MDRLEPLKTRNKGKAHRHQMQSKDVKFVQNSLFYFMISSVVNIFRLKNSTIFSQVGNPKYLPIFPFSYCVNEKFAQLSSPVFQNGFININEIIFEYLFEIKHVCTYKYCFDYFWTTTNTITNGGMKDNWSINTHTGLVTFICLFLKNRDKCVLKTLGLEHS